MSSRIRITRLSRCAVRREAQFRAGRCNSKKMLGITRSTTGGCTTKPEMIATARGCCIDKPWLIASANGSSVRMAASVVITIGRIRFCPASINAI